MLDSRQKAIFEFVRHCSEGLLDFVSGVRPAFYVLDDELHPICCEPLRDTPSSAAHAYLHRIWRSDPLLPGGDNQISATIRSLRGFRSACPTMGGEFDRFVRSEGCIDALKIDFVYGGYVVGGFAIGRDANCGPFNANDLNLLERCSRLIDFAASYGDSRKRTSVILDSFDFTRRELEVVELVREGLTNCAIASHCNISLATVKTHLLNIFAKTDVKNRAGLVSILS